MRLGGGKKKGRKKERKKPKKYRLQQSAVTIRSSAPSSEFRLRIFFFAGLCVSEGKKKKPQEGGVIVAPLL